MNTIQVGILGYGLSGSVYHAPLLAVLDEYHISKVMTSRTEEVKRDFPDAEVVHELEEMTNDPAIELVIVTTPSGLHYEHALACIQAGKHVVIEKPMTATAEEGENLKKAADERGVLLSVYHNRRWDNDFLTIKQLIDDGSLEDINTYQVSYDRYKPEVQARWREKEGAATGTLYDLGSHIIDQALHLFGMPKVVTAKVMAQREHAETVDYFHLTMDYGKLQAILYGGSIAAANGPRYQIHGQHSSFIKYGIDGQEDALRAGKKPENDSWGADDPESYGQLTTVHGENKKTETIPSVNGSYLTYYRKVADSIREGAPLPVTAEEGIDVIRIIEAAVKSSEEKRTISLEQ
ncbi:oxidoreductase [Bacillus mojavensis]|uniref:oxidoreductase n=1 Tax=Bacillus mojavensis TaxID=72360 RepID=UPI002DB994EA|nr:oxidoreductase [Bacillus mojavensis]MEC1288697.1 oxidoreductase [Bacillus mojavensis]MEC1634403.1 oxidoreductase [Bacillus mojavensis]MEC1704133.1 oxidoreductase [Bacillus mojavensis]MEC5245723.1 oxidoreductase [Bacillus mojavensis]